MITMRIWECSRRSPRPIKVLVECELLPGRTPRWASLDQWIGGPPSLPVHETLLIVMNGMVEQHYLVFYRRSQSLPFNRALPEGRGDFAACRISDWNTRRIINPYSGNTDWIDRALPR